MNDERTEQSPRERFEAEARAWHLAGRPEVEAAPWQTAVLRLWTESEGARREGLGPMLAEYLSARVAALDARSPGWYARLLDEHDYCARCGERYRLENLSLCTDCGTALCYRHQTDGGTSPNGNGRCPSCGVGEIVG